MSDSYKCTGDGRHDDITYYGEHCPVCILLDSIYQVPDIDIRVRSNATVEITQNMGDDSMIVHAARVSTRGQYVASELTNKEIAGVINYLMKHRHGTPFEHGAMTFFVRAPIFVWREWHRHRVGFSYNEESARYSQLEPEFWVPAKDRNIIPVDGFKAARPQFRAGTHAEYEWLIKDMIEGYKNAYGRYQRRIDRGIAKEVARAGLPFGIYSSCWVTCNCRSLMHFLSLRTSEPTAKFPSYPQYEIEQAARIAEQVFSLGWPLTHAAYCENGRVAP